MYNSHIALASRGELCREKLKRITQASSLCLRVKTRLSGKPFISERVAPTGSFSCKSNSFSFEWFRTLTRFETEAQRNSEMAHKKNATFISCEC